MLYYIDCHQESAGISDPSWFDIAIWHWPSIPAVSCAQCKSESHTPNFM